MGRLFGRNKVVRFRDLTSESYSLRSKKFGEVTVDCQLLLSRSQFGCLQKNDPAGIFYMRLSFSGTGDLVSTKISVTLSEDRNDSDSVPASTCEITSFFGPRRLGGPPHDTDVKVSDHGTPNFTFGSYGGLGNVGRDKEKSYKTSRWWTFKASLLPGKASGTPQKLQWVLDEGNVPTQPDHGNEFYLAFAFKHYQNPCVLGVKIEGKQKLGDKILSFPRLPQQGAAKVQIHCAEPARLQTILDSKAQKLDAEMVDENEKAMKTTMMSSQPHLPMNGRKEQAEKQESVVADEEPGARALVTPARDRDELIQTVRATAQHEPAHNSGTEGVPEVRGPARVDVTQDQGTVNGVAATKPAEDAVGTMKEIAPEEFVIRITRERAVYMALLLLITILYWRLQQVTHSLAVLQTQAM